MKRSRRKRRHSIPGLAFIWLMMLMIGFLIGQESKPASHSSAKPVEKKTQKNDKQTIYPTIYIGGSGGGGASDKILSSYDPQKDAYEKSHLHLSSHDGKLSAKGEIDEADHFPLISFGVMIGKTGTKDGFRYIEPLKKAIQYLQKHYNVPYVNLIGHSSGATGAIDYIVEYSMDKKLPAVNKFISFDGEFNDITPLQANETLANVLLSGPRKKTLMYTYVEDNYKKIDPKIKVLMLVGQKNYLSQSDGFIPWADGFAINYLLAKNGNSLTAKFYATNYSHAEDEKDPTAAAIVREFLKDKKMVSNE